MQDRSDSFARLRDSDLGEVVGSLAGEGNAGGIGRLCSFRTGGTPVRRRTLGTGRSADVYLGSILPTEQDIDTLERSIKSMGAKKVHEELLTVDTLTELSDDMSATAVHGIEEKQTFCESEEGTVLFDPKGAFIDWLKECLKAKLNANNVTIASIRKKERTTRIEQAVVEYSYEDGSHAAPMRGTIYIKDYGKQQDLAKKDIAVNLLCKELALPSLTLVSDIDPMRQQFDDRYGLFHAGSMLTMHAEGDDLIDLIRQGKYSPNLLADQAGYILKSLARMSVRITKNLKQGAKFGLSLESPALEIVMFERFGFHLNISSYSHPFYDAVRALESLVQGRRDFVQADFTAANVRVGKSYSDVLIHDFELSRLGASIEDSAMLGVFSLSVAPFRNITDTIKQVYAKFSDAYFVAYNAVCEAEDASGYKIGNKEYRISEAVYELLSHAMKMADQVWTQREFGLSAARQDRFMWHMHELFRLSTNDLQECLAPYKKQVKAFSSEALGALLSCPDIGYGKAQMQNYRCILARKDK